MPILFPTVQSYSGHIQEVARLDAAPSMFLARQLLSLEVQSFKEKFPNLLMRRLFNVKNKGRGLDEIGYKIQKNVGRFKVVSDGAKDLPKLSSGIEEKLMGIKLMAGSVEWTKRDMDKANRLQMPFDTDMLKVARQTAEIDIDEKMFYGDAENNIKGLLSADYLALYNKVTLSTNGTGATDRAKQRIINKTGPEVIKEFNKIFNVIPKETKGVFRADRCIISDEIYDFLAGTPVSETSTVTLLEFISRNKRVEFIPYSKCATVTALDNEDLIMAFPNDIEVANLEIPVEFEQEPLEKDRFNYYIDCSFEISGLALRYPKAFSYAYADGTNA